MSEMKLKGNTYIRYDSLPMTCKRCMKCQNYFRSLDGDELEGLRVACRLGREVAVQQT